jgi:hypothetical protein
VAGLTAKRLDPLGLAMLAIAYQRMHVSIGDAEVRALLVGTSKALGIHASGGLPAGFSPCAKVAQEQALAFHPTRQWRRDDRRGKRVGSGA